MKNILVGIDLDDNADNLIIKAQDLAKRYGAKLWLLHVVPPISEYVGYDITVYYSNRTEVDAIKNAQWEKLMVYVEKVKEFGVEAEGVLIEGAATTVIIEESKKLNVDLIICGHHERSVFYNFIFGSVASSVVRNSEIPVLVYPFK